MLYLHNLNGEIFALRNVNLKDHKAVEEPNCRRRRVRKTKSLSRASTKFEKSLRMGSRMEGNLRDTLELSGVCIFTVWLLPSRQ